MKLLLLSVFFVLSFLRLVLTKNKIESVVQFRTVRTENFIHAYDRPNCENFITGERLAAVPSLLYSSAVGKTVIKEAPVRV